MSRASSHGRCSPHALVALACGLLSACATPGSQFPLLEERLPDDSRQACAGIDEQLEKADVLRTAIFKESKQAIGMDALDGALDLAFDPITGALAALGRTTGAIRREEKFRQAVAASEQRLRVLLELREASACLPVAPFAAAPLTPAEILEGLRRVDDSLAAKSIPADAASARRRVLFDGLRAGTP